MVLSMKKAIRLKFRIAFCWISCVTLYLVIKSNVVLVVRTCPETNQSLVQTNQGSIYIHAGLRYKGTEESLSQNGKPSEIYGSQNENVSKIHSEDNKSQNENVITIRSENKSQDENVTKIRSENNKIQNVNVSQLHIENNKSQHQTGIGKHSDKHGTSLPQRPKQSILPASRGTSDKKLGVSLQEKHTGNVYHSQLGHYFTPRSSKVNPIEFKLVINADHSCKNGVPFLLVMVPSTPAHFTARDIIRKTYGSFSQNTVNSIPNSSLQFTMKIVFLLGKRENENVDELVKNESIAHRDIVQAEFADSYNNLTRKMVIALKWTETYCADIGYFLKVDEDVFVNIPLLVQYLRNQTTHINGTMYGHVQEGSVVDRIGKWAVGLDQYPLKHYPRYACGNSYVIPGNLIPKLAAVAEYVPYIPIEDAFVTGILRRVVQAKLVHDRRFTYFYEKRKYPCPIINSGRISATKVGTSLMKRLWLAQTQFKTYCMDYLNSSSLII